MGAHQAQGGGQAGQGLLHRLVHENFALRGGELHTATGGFEADHVGDVDLANGLVDRAHDEAAHGGDRIGRLEGLAFGGAQ